MTLNLRHTEVSSGRTARDHGCHPYDPVPTSKTSSHTAPLDCPVTSDATNCILHLQSFGFLGSRRWVVLELSHFLLVIAVFAQPVPRPHQPLPAELPMLCSKAPGSKIYLLIVDRVKFYYESLIIDIISFTATYSNF